MLPSGEKESSGSLLSLANVTRHDSGTYICEAANGVDNPVRAKIDLRIICKLFLGVNPDEKHFPHLVIYFIDEPEIHVDKAWIHADVGVEVEISCIVHAEPRAEVSNDQRKESQGDKCGSNFSFLAFHFSIHLLTSTQ